MPPPITIAKPPPKEGGLLPVAAAQTQPNAAPKPPPARLKVLIRRLPPGLTEKEFQEALGQEWTATADGKVDWFQYKPGKVSKDLSKPSKPARAYLHVKEASLLDSLSDKFRQTTFEDARKTTKDAVLIGPPQLEFAQYQRISAGRRRNDARQGLIDQDPEFIAFLESLTNPVVKPANIDAQDAAAKADSVTVTPLIQHLREKKAAKEKAASQKNAKKQAKAAEGDSKADKKAKQAPDGEEKKSRRSKADKAEAKKENVKAKAETTSTTASEPTKETPSKRQNQAAASNAGAVRMLQRDLGLSGATGRGGSNAPAKSRGRSNKQNAADGATKPTATSSTKAETTPATTDQAAEPVAKQTASNKQTSKAAATTNQTSARAKPNPTPAPTSTQAFLKHANPSQGITEALLEETLSRFGKVVKVDIDKRKGFAFVDFAEPSGLQKAMADSPIKVAQGQVQVLERKDRPAANKENHNPAARSSGSAAAAANSPASASTSAPTAAGGAATAASGTSGSGRGGRGGRSGKGRGGGGRGGGGAAASDSNKGEQKAAPAAAATADGG